MKKAIIAALGLVVAIAYPASAWLIGKQVEAKRQELSGGYLAEAKDAGVNVITRDYQRGIFSASETLVIEIPADILFGTDSEDLFDSTEMADLLTKPIRLTARASIKHGPILGFSLPGAALEESEISFDGELQEKIGQIFKGQAVLSTKTRYGFFGGGSMHLSSPAFTYTTPADERGESDEIKWAGLKLASTFTDKAKQMNVDLTMPKLAIKHSTGRQINFEDFRFTGQYLRVLDDLPSVYAMSGNMQLASFQSQAQIQAHGKQSASIKKINIDIASPTEGDFIDFLFKLKVDEVLLGEEKLGSGQYDFSLRHLHMRSFAEFTRAAGKFSQDQQMAPTGGSEIFGALKTPFLNLIAEQPELRIDQLDVNTPQGNVKLTAVAKLDAGAPGDESLPDEALAISLATRVNVKADISLAQELIGKRVAERLLQQGFVQKDGTDLKTTISLEQGKFFANGKAFNPPLGLMGMGDLH